MPKQTEQEFVDQYHGYIPRRCARDLYRAIYPTGMHTNGPTMVTVHADHLSWLISPHKRPTEGKADAP